MKDSMSISQMPDLPDPCAWVSFNVLTQKEIIGRMPTISLQHGEYQHQTLYSADQMHEYAASALSAERAEVVRLREALEEIAEIIITGPTYLQLKDVKSFARAALTPTQGEAK